MSSTGPGKPRFEPPTYGSGGPSVPSSAPKPSYTPPPSQGYHGSYTPPPVAPKTNTLAIVSLVCMIIPPLLVLGVPAILGGIALNQIKKSRGTEKGEGLAIAGIVIGAIGLFILIFGGLGSLVSG